MTDAHYRGSFIDASHRLDRHRDRLRERERALAELAAMQVAFSSASGAVQITVNSDGLLLALELSSVLNGVPAARIAEQVMQVYSAAQRAAAARATELLETTFGDHHAVAEKYRNRLRPEGPSAQMPSTTGDAPDAPSTERTPAARAHTHHDDDDDLNQASLYRG